MSVVVEHARDHPCHAFRNGIAEQTVKFPKEKVPRAQANSTPSHHVVAVGKEKI